MKFGNIILAVASWSVIDVLLYFLLGLVLIPSMGSYWGLNTAGIISLLIASLLVGYIFALKIQEESRIRSIGKISVLGAFIMPISVLLSAAANPYYKDLVDETLKSMYSTSAWTATDWYVYGQFALISVAVLNVVLALVLTFVGVYCGSMFRKSKQS